jgi:RNA-directed DNA polymerase
VIKRKTARSRRKRALLAMSESCRKNRHRPIKEQHQTLKQKVQGHYGYYEITGNIASLQKFQLGAVRTWKRWLSRRRRGRTFSWSDFARLAMKYALPRARVVHSFFGSVAN